MRHWYGQNYNKSTHTNKNTCNPPLRMKDGNKKTPSNIPTGAPFLLLLRFFYCYEDWSPYFDTDDASKAYTIASFIVIYMVPFTTTIIFYSLISHYLWLRKIPGNGNKSSKRRVTASRRKIILMLITIVFCFIVCWLTVQIVIFSLFFG